MTAKNWPNGLNEASGDSLVVNPPFYTSGEVYYVHMSGSDSYDGRDRKKPLASIGAAVGKSQKCDVVVCLDGHIETISTMNLLTEGLTIVGAGKAGGLPTVKLTPSSTSANMFVVENNCVSFRNLWFCAHSSTSTFSKISMSGGEGDQRGTLIKDCYFEQGGTDTGPAVLIGALAEFARIQGTTFISTATSSTAQPLSAIGFVAAASSLGLVIEDTAFDGGAEGFSDFWAVDTSGGINDVFRFERVSLLNGADIKLGADDGFMNIGTAQGGARIDWNPDG